LGAVIAALALGGCYEPSGQPNGLVSQPVNTTRSARSGGLFKSFLANDTNSFDPLAAPTPIAPYTYPRLLRFQTGLYPHRPVGGVEGDLAESIEVTGDNLQITLRLREGLKWEQRAPTNGRTIDANDVVFSWNKFARLHSSRNDLVYHAEQAPGAPFESVRQTDARTVVFRLKQPDASALGLPAGDGLFYVMPRESDGGFDPRLETRGYGPWLMTENQPNALRVWTKNPDYHLRERPYPDKLEQVVIGDYGARVAQFKAGLIWPNVAARTDVLGLKRDIPALLLRETDAFATAPALLSFGYDGGSPWKDERLRQAVSMLIDREALIETRTNRSALAAEGIGLAVRYHTAIGAGWDTLWVDPTDPGVFGPNAQYYRFDPEEARRLIDAAGYPDGLDTVLHYNGATEAPAYVRNAELVSGLLYEGGIRATLDPREQNDWLPNYYYAYTSAANGGKSGQGFPGIIYRPAASYPMPATQVFATMHRQGTRFLGMTPDGKNASQGDPEVNQQIEAMRREFDRTRQRALALEFARTMAAKAYAIPILPHAALNLTASWPVIGNLGVYMGWPGGSAAAETQIQQWIDGTKPPLGSPA
jgi:ABC-type transport system substrate-binding protein